MNLELLKKHLPEDSITYLYEWLKDSSVVIQLRANRKTKLGDYIYEPKNRLHKISINSSLKPEAFFFVLTHEIAHLIARKTYSRNIKPHGKEWKAVFRDLLLESAEIYNEEVRPLIRNHAYRPKASMAADVALNKALFVNEEHIGNLLEGLPEGQRFRLGKRIFLKGKQRKIRYICRELKNNRSYLISGQVVVDEIIDE
ncbi:MAG: SprT-like domain-containing protein [Weeksellaceae bacterium]|jgi:hypothetical protein|nr:SprT-like domain-containing protein [Weeksellaceae bacterium]